MDQPEESKKSLSFGFFRKQETIQLKKSAVGDHDEKEDTSKDFVTSLEGKDIKSTRTENKKNKKSTDDFVIPLINQNRWRTEKEGDESRGKNDSDNLDLQAAEEILKQSAMLNEEWDKKGSTEDTTRAIPLPLLMQNKIPDGFETDNKLDVKLRPQEPNDADYEQIPIEHFGLAMLRGMGWNESRGVGKQGKVIAPVEAQIRPKGLGLGADRSNKEVQKNSVSTEGKDSSDQLVLKKGSFCVISAGSNKDLYGIVEGIDEDNCRVMVKLTLSGKTVNLMQCNINLVSKKEYEKFSKYLNKQKVDKFKEDEEKRKKASEEQNGRYNDKQAQKRQQADEDLVDFPEREYKKHRKEDHESSGHHKHSKHKSKHKSHKKKKDHKNDRDRQSPSRHDKRKSESSENEDSDIISEEQRPWLQQDLRVRVIDKAFKYFYKEKVVIVDVPVPGQCVCKASDGKVLDGISQSSLETVIPRDDSSFVLIVSGSHRGQVGQIMKRDKDQCLALVQLLSDRDTVLKLGYDEICEYVGDVHSRDDY